MSGINVGQTLSEAAIVGVASAYAAYKMAPGTVQTKIATSVVVGTLAAVVVTGVNTYLDMQNARAEESLSTVARVKDMQESTIPKQTVQAINQNDPPR